MQKKKKAPGVLVWDGLRGQPAANALQKLRRKCKMRAGARVRVGDGFTFRPRENSCPSYLDGLGVATRLCITEN